MVNIKSFRTWISIVLIGYFATLFGCLSGQSQFINHIVESPFQKDSTIIRVLLPDDFDSKKTYKVLYVLPVIENDNRRFGDGLLEMYKYNYHNIHQLICVAPEFSSPPWFADHDTDKGKQDESHFMKTVIPFIDQNYPTFRSNKGRLLIGFSKSGWGAFTLLMRHPEIFFKAAGWDIGIRMDTEGLTAGKRLENMEIIYGSTANFDRYRISNLLKEKKEILGDKERLFYYNTEGKRGPGGVQIHSLMVELGIPHRYVYESVRKHRWDTGWIPSAVKFLMEN